MKKKKMSWDDDTSFNLVIECDPENRRYKGFIPEIPGCLVVARTYDGAFYGLERKYAKIKHKNLRHSTSTRSGSIGQ
jgi:hypothetical protein